MHRYLIGIFLYMRLRTSAKILVVCRQLTFLEVDIEEVTGVDRLLEMLLLMRFVDVIEH